MESREHVKCVSSSGDVYQQTRLAHSNEAVYKQLTQTFEAETTNTQLCLTQLHTHLHETKQCPTIYI